MRRLKSLDLSGYRITDAGLRALYGLKNLKTLNISGTQVTEVGIRELQSHLPGAEVYFVPVYETPEATVIQSPE
jgi:hypothetical protein